MKVGIYVGSFNPPHNGHFAIAKYLARKYLDKVVIIPTGNYWDKTDLLPIDVRLEMLKFIEDDSIIVQKEGSEYQFTLDILHFLSKQYANDELYLILGADNISELNKWHEYKEILKYHLAIINRNGIDVKGALKALGKPVDECIVTDELEEIDISSTKIRNFLSAGNYEAVKALLPPQVLEYIVQEGLYK